MSHPLPSNMTNQQIPDMLVAEYAIRSDYFEMSANHLHPHYELYILLSGERNYFIRDQVYAVHTGELVFIGKDELHRTLPGELPEHERIVLYFNDQFAQRQWGNHVEWLLGVFQRKSPVFRTDPRDSMLMEIIQQLVRELTKQQQGYMLMVQQLMTELLIHCARQPEEAPVAPDKVRSITQEQMSRVAVYIKQHYKDSLSLDQLAQQFHLSPAHLSRTFKRTTGFHLAEYINIVRIQAAQQMLSETELKIIDIAQIVGFGNFSHFGKVFKQLCHKSPREFRKESNKKSLNK